MFFNMLYLNPVILCTYLTLVAGLSDNIIEDASLDVPGLIQKYEYTFEDHNVTTSDGYILGLHRIPSGHNNKHTDNQTDRPVALLLHGLFSTSADYTLMGPNTSLGYLLADNGYDVWMGNARGNRYSRRHLTYNPNSILNDDFWKFSWDEIGNIDVPAMIDYILAVTGKSKLHYVGYSQGTTAFFVMCSLRPEYNDKIISMQAMAPVAYLANTRVLLFQAISPFSTSIEMLTSLIGIGELLPNNQLLAWAGKALCLQEAVTEELCNNILFLVSGWNIGQLNVTTLPMILSHFPAGSSVRQLAHYGQSVSEKQFKRYNHGWLKNKQVYGSISPPNYSLSKVTTPIYLYYSDGDSTADVKDVERLYEELGAQQKSKYKVEIENFSHLAFSFGKDAKSLVYDRLIESMRAMD